MHHDQHRRVFWPINTIMNLQSALECQKPGRRSRILGFKRVIGNIVTPQSEPASSQNSGHNQEKDENPPEHARNSAIFLRHKTVMYNAQLKRRFKTISNKTNHVYRRDSPDLAAGEQSASARPVRPLTIILHTVPEDPADTSSQSVTYDWLSAR